MAGIDGTIARAVTGANTAQQLAQAAMMEFSAHCAASDWPRAEEARARAMAHMEAHLDGIAAVYRTLSSQK